MPSRPVIAWALYDWANSAFATTVMAGLFPVFFKQYWAADLAATESTFWLGVTNSAASLLVVLAAPVVGALADSGPGKKRLLGGFAGLGIATTAALYLVAQGHWQLAVALYGLGIVGFSAGNVCYDALIVDVAEPRAFDRVSALGFALGYLGGGLLFALDVWMVRSPATFGLADPASAVRVAFLSVAVWWALFSVPLMVTVRERREPPRTGLATAARRAVAELLDTARDVRRYRMAWLFLIAYWLYIDGVDTIVRMAVDYGLALGFRSSDLLAALLITQFVGFPAAIAFGRIGERLGPKTGIGIALAVYSVVVLWAWRMDSAAEFYGLAIVIGLVQGGVQALSRSLYARLVPPGRAGEFFGFYNMMGKFAAVLGPVLVGWTAAVTGDSRAGILSVLALFGAGAVVLARVDVARGQQAAAA